MKRFTPIAIACCVAGPASATARADPVRYELNKTHTSIRASWDHWGYSRQAIEFTRYDGTLLLDLDAPARSSIEVTFTLADGLWVGAPDDARFETHLASAELFDIAKFPTATFKSTTIEPRDAGHFVVRGELTIKDRTQPIALDVELNKRGENGGKRRAGFSATGTIDRALWGLGFGAPQVPNEVRISIETELVGPAP